ncbi:L,D-transpeptidase [Phytoactinopolyspora halotolerans]|uniref:L,D-transpeptidase n=1 Tax=Phytoactinopolyspora halotolerans TaxID=1981512 RepID=A0A6L9S212_9ACTN|nr:Ig-like domain-containing protein [Phytoactinopolyspora halotolerans]NED99066.1 L,D-transpeptidase [Phytoactinopolyspora halotolerans]
MHRTHRSRRGLAAGCVSLALALTLAACGGDDSELPTHARQVHALTQLKDLDDTVDFSEPLSLEISAGQIESVEVVSTDGDRLEGQVNDDGRTWSSANRPEPGADYEITVAAADQFGESHTFSDQVSVAEVPDGERLTLAMLPSNESEVGVGAPIVVQFDQPVTDREAVERHMHVSSDPQVVGSWHWVNDQEARFRPKEYWPAGTQVALDLDLNGVQAGENLWGGRSYHLEFQVGSAQIAEVNADTYRMDVKVDGEREYRWNTSLGAPDFATRNGTYVVLEKFEERNMTSCNANITCDESDPDYYDVDTDWAVRLSYSGTFVHSAPWSEESQGEDNVSHGCINLNDKNGETFFNMVRYGDVVTVKNSTRDANDLVQRGDPGMVDWNQSWKDYVAGSALGEEITTDEL